MRIPIQYAPTELRSAIQLLSSLFQQPSNTAMVIIDMVIRRGPSTRWEFPFSAVYFLNLLACVLIAQTLVHETARIHCTPIMIPFAHRPNMFTHD